MTELAADSPAARALALAEKCRAEGINAFSDSSEGWCQDIPCPYCRVDRGESCRSYTGNTTGPHKVRVEQSLRKRREERKDR